MLKGDLLKMKKNNIINKANNNYHANPTDVTTIYKKYDTAILFIPLCIGSAPIHDIKLGYLEEDFNKIKTCSYEEAVDYLKSKNYVFCDSDIGECSIGPMLLAVTITETWKRQ